MEQEHDSGDDIGAAEAFDAARKLLDLCVDHLEKARVRLVLVGGVLEREKTTLAECVGARRSWTVLRSDGSAQRDGRPRADDAWAAGLRTGRASHP